MQNLFLGCFKHKIGLHYYMPLQRKPTEFACSSLVTANRDIYDWNNKLTDAFVICAHFAKMNGFKVIF